MRVKTYGHVLPHLVCHKGGFLNSSASPGSTLKAFEQLPRHLSDELYLFSLEDLVRTKKGLLAPLLKHVLKVSLMHVADCEVRGPLEQACVPEPFLCWLFCSSSQNPGGQCG